MGSKGTPALNKMKILLAGYNMDTEVIESFKKASGERPDATPETLSASYARISRDPRPINELRSIARAEVEKARKSNRNIIFKMGHHSVAEHAVFNFDLIGVSRLAVEEIEHFRLCSFTEKSQRYIKLDNDYVVPAEIKGTKHEALFRDTVEAQNAFYHRLSGALEGEAAREDARYIASLATEGQLGMTINARNLELLFRRFASSDLAEVREIGSRMFALVEKIAPSIILFTKANDYDRKTLSEMVKAASPYLKRRRTNGKAKEVTLEGFTRNADDMTVAALLHTSGTAPFGECLKTSRSMKRADRKNLVKAALKHMELYDAAPREFEYVNLTYNLIVSSACFGQLKRHRFATIVSQKYDPALGVTIPDSVKEADMDGEFIDVVNRTNRAFETIAKTSPRAAEYVLTNSHRKRVLLGLNARELYHISRLREDAHAQWDIRRLSAEMTKAARKRMPLTMLLIGGKDSYPESYKKVYGKYPKVLQAEPPK